jgi:hypothetical protein
VSTVNDETEGEHVEVTPAPVQVTEAEYDPGIMPGFVTVNVLLPLVLRGRPVIASVCGETRTPGTSSEVVTFTHALSTHSPSPSKINFTLPVPDPETE